MRSTIRCRSSGFMVVLATLLFAFMSVIVRPTAASAATPQFAQLSLHSGAPPTAAVTSVATQHLLSYNSIRSTNIESGYAVASGSNADEVSILNEPSYVRQTRRPRTAARQFATMRQHLKIRATAGRR